MDTFTFDSELVPENYVPKQDLLKSLDRLEALVALACQGQAQRRDEMYELLHGIRLEAQQLIRDQIQLTMLYKTGRELASILDLEELLTSLLDRAIHLLQAERGLLILHKDNEDGFEVVLARGIDTSEIEQTGEAHSQTTSRQLIQHVLQSRRPLITTNAQGDSRFSSSIVALQIRSVLATPLIYQNELIGAIYLDTRTNQRTFDESDLRLLNAMANQVSVAIHIAQLYENLKAKNRELAAALQELRATQAELIKTERLSAIGQMASSIIHDIKGPLTTVKGLAELLGRSDLTAEQRLDLSMTISRSIDSFVGMTQEILDYAHGQQVLALEQVNVAQFLGSLRDFILQDFAASNIRVALDIRYEGAMICDDRKLWRALYNIAENAKEAMIKEQGKEHVFTIASRQRGPWIEIILADTGPGIPPELREKIFLPFATYGKTRGTGLGLCIAHSIVQAHGGTIDLTSEVGRGSTFTVRIPIEVACA